MRVIKDNILVKPDQEKKSALIIEGIDDAFSRGTVVSSSSEEVGAGCNVIFGDDYYTIAVGGEKYLVMHHVNVKVYFPKEV